MLSVESLAGMRQRLDVYDVAQSGWEQEPNGFIANAEHVVTHIDKATWVKDLTDKSILANEVIPDSVQYALRLSRWGDFDVASLVPNRATDKLIKTMGSNYPRTAERRPDIIALNGARVILNTTILHDAGHESSRKVSERPSHRKDVAAKSGRLLMFAAGFEADHFKIEIEPLFDARLAQLRKDFHIPNPDDVTDITISKQDFRSNWRKGYGQSWRYVANLAKTQEGFPMHLVLDHEGNETLSGNVLAAYQWIRDRDIYPTRQTILRLIASHLPTPEAE